MRLLPCVCVLSLALPAAVSAQEADADALAKALSNPVAALISVPLQYNYDETYGDEGYRHSLNVQPVVPISVSEHVNMISRTILPIVYQNDVIPGTDQAGIGDVTQSLFFSPKEPSASGLIWGVGPAILLPTGTDDLSADTWAMGPTAVVLKQDGAWTYGALVNHLVDVRGTGDRRAEINSTFLQPFLSRSLGKGRTVTLNFESTYDWEAEQWNVPVNVMYSKVSKIGNQMVSYAGGVRGYLETPDGGPDWGVRLVLTLLYPR
ncbi:outer membrane putative beta-barrel porin/alpha-amylase [Luteimonas cucumeris]|uniref:Outer membrane putative beta-barrel porin/alpha-amylase n=2 Tax=Luteimonas cucumeris TaxID=985012 RepID=A0A562KXU2_9GAMM|nr:outer membrane putative beta-barrel porin/alpha-amylase [Luteimonas cucumeris]